MKDFDKTQIGRKFYEADIPRLILALENIAKKIDSFNKIQEKKSKLEERLTKQKIKNISKL
jgi:hypothetical protein